jgi:hypothetical protein
VVYDFREQKVAKHLCNKAEVLVVIKVPLQQSRAGGY